MVEALSILKVCLIFLLAAIFNCLVFLWTHHSLGVSLKVLILTLCDLILDSDLLCYVKNRTYIVSMYHSFNAAILLGIHALLSRSHSVVQAGLQQSSCPILLIADVSQRIWLASVFLTVMCIVMFIAEPRCSWVPLLKFSAFLIAVCPSL